MTVSDSEPPPADPPDGMHMFHRVSYLLSGEGPVAISPDLTIPEALKLMRDYGFAQMPVVAGKEVLGLFSHRSFSERLMNSQWLWSKTRTPETLVVEDFIETPVYVRAVEPIDKLFTAMDDVDAVLVGDPDRLQGIVTSSDVIAYLYRVASPYLLLKETETGLRSLIEAAVTPEKLRECAQQALANLYQGREDRLPTSLVAMTFDEQVSIVMNTRNWPAFAGVMGASRDMFTYEIRPVGQIRNDVFHFKRELTDEDLEKLMTAREWVLRKLRRKVGPGR
ncbi:CBS domain-containing protein [Streptomyces sp. NBC_00340]|uniref:CBS domain-containing protein n=1 Tax=Streptomyces sp. NBC_00340 TaxID=2975716 RepID=UPI00224C86A4|nr:CBS domain-containing protein [Streptomyces sp. NBC_00340]MCX5136409.1 CBS domain-containing protein [Streptomyces sp. NBC_00340]